MNKFEQLIEHVINNEDAKAKELFHEIVVEKSRTIYEEMMQDEELEEAKAEDLDEASDEDLEEGEEDLEENMLGGDQSDDLIDDVETEEEGMSMEGEEEEVEFGAEEGGEEGLEDRVVDLEDKLDELMAEFEALMGDEAGEEHMDGDDLADVSADNFGGDETGEEEIDDTEFETEGMMENVTLKAVPKPTAGDHGANNKSVVAANSGARGAMAKPVHATGDGGNGRPAPGTKELIGKVGNSPAQSTQKPTPATKPQLGQAAGVNTKSIIQ
jgi:hypothetical protein